MTLITTLVGTRFDKLGNELGINHLKRSGKRCHDITEEIIRGWIRQKKSRATWRVLRNAMKNIGAGVTLIDKRCQKKKNVSERYLRNC